MQKKMSLKAKRKKKKKKKKRKEVKKMKKNLTALLLASILLTLSGSLDTDAKAERFSLTDLSASQPEYDPGEPF